MQRLHLITVTDITPLKQAEAQQRRLRHEMTRARRQLRDAIEVISEGFILFDCDDRLVMFNQRYRDEFSYAPEALVPGTTYADIEKIVRQTGGKLLKEVNLFDVYHDEKADILSYAISMRLQDADKTLGEKAIDKTVHRVREQLAQRLGVTLR